MNHSSLNNSRSAMYRQLLLPVFVPSFLMSVCQGSALLLIPLYALELGGSPAIAAVIFACRGLGNMAADIPAGLAAQRFGDAKVMKAGIFLMVIATSGCALANGLIQLALMALIIGLSMATWLLARLTLISDLVESSQRGQALSTMAGLQRFGHFLGPMILGSVVYVHGYTTAFFCLAGLALATLVLLSKRQSKTSKPHDDANIKHAQLTETEPTKLHPLIALLSTHRSIFLSGGSAVFLLTLVRAARTLLIPLWGTWIGLNIAEIGLIVGLAAGIDMVMFPVAGLIMDHWGRRPAGMICLGLLSTSLFLLSQSTEAWTFAAAACIAGLGNGLGSGINMTLGTDFAPSNQRGHFLGIWRMIGDAGAFAGPTLISSVAATIGLGPSLGISATLGFIGVFIIARFVPETRIQSSKHSDSPTP
ncbi:MAG: MFS transporter [Pseudomonadales bacterium]